MANCITREQSSDVDDRYFLKIYIKIKKNVELYTSKPIKCGYFYHYIK